MIRNRSRHSMEGETNLKKILVVDDHQHVRELVEATLMNGEYQIFQACGGEEAIEAARSKRPELIIMDIIMPGIMDGIEAARIIKNDIRTSGCKIIMLQVHHQG